MFLKNKFKNIISPYLVMCALLFVVRFCVEKQAPSYNKDWLRLNVFWYCAFWYTPFISVVFIASPFFVFVGTTFAIDLGNVWIRDYSSNAWKLQFKFNDGEKCRDYCDATVCEADYPKKVNNGWQCCCSKRFE